MGDAVASFPVAKIAYSAVLVAVIWFFAKELVRVWADHQTYIAPPTYFADGKVDAAKATAFGGQILAHYHRMAHDLQSEGKEARETVPDAAQLLPIKISKTSGITSVPKDAQQLELKVQGFDVGGLLAKLRSWVKPNNEVDVTVEARDVGKETALVEAAVSWPMAPSWSAEEPSRLRYFTTSRISGEEDAAGVVAGTLLWAAISKEQTDVRKIPQDQFVTWLLAWQRYKSIRDLGLPPGKLDDAHKAILGKAGKGIKPFLDRKPVFPEFLRLAANMLSQHPDTIPGNKLSWEHFRNEYEVALGKRPSSAPILARAQSAPNEKLGPGVLLWRGDGRLAARVTAVVKDAGGKLYLLLPALLQENASMPFDLFIGVGPHQGMPIARATKIIAPSANGPGVVLAELVGNGASANGALRALGTAPKLNDELHMAGATQIGTVQQVETTITGIGPGFVVVKPKVTSVGDAGAPFVDGQGRLVAMGYAGTDDASFLLPLPELFKKNQLDLDDTLE